MPRALSLSAPFHPTTFLERGVSVAFTTPALVGSRVRAGSRTGLEVIVPNPAGGRGCYVLPWAGVQELCSPTVHDRQLQTRVETLSIMTPSGIRAAAREVAAEGFAGREAKAAALAAGDRDSEAQVVANFYLLLRLMAQLEDQTVDAEQERTDTLEERAKTAIATMAPRVGLDADTVASSLEELAVVMRHVGVGPHADQTSTPQTLARLVALRADMERWSADHDGEDGTMADAVRSTAELTISCSRTALAETRTLTAKVAELLTRWRSDPELIRNRAARPEWLLDGWEPICALWQSAGDDAAKEAAIREMFGLVPVLPKEVGDWIDTASGLAAKRTFSRLSELNKDWRSGMPVLDLVARNEHLRAVAA